MSLPKFTRKRKHILAPNKVRYNSLHYIGSGSYGSIYEIENTNMVLKEHRIFTMDNQSLCTNWKHEFEIQMAMVDVCNPSLQSYSSAIVKPFLFTYAKRDESNRLIPQDSIENAQSCFFTMERVPGFASSPPCFGRKLFSILKPEHTLSPTLIPPYLYLGSLQGLHGHITLDMLHDTTCIEFPNEAQNYCIVEGIALTLMKNMFISFFMIAEHGFIPRDIEFVFNGSCANYSISILDCNEVKTHDERRYGRPDYNINRDLAHVYIDLCGLRSSNSINPEAPYDNPTPQWKFLCSPLISPYAFFECIESMRKLRFNTFSLDDVVSEILRYVEKYVFKPFLEHRTLDWTPKQTEFSHTYADFDTHLQMYYIHRYVDSLRLRKIEIVMNPVWSYNECLHYLQSLTHTHKSILNMDDEWDQMWSVRSDYSTKTKSDDIFRLRKRRYSVRRPYTDKSNTVLGSK